MKTLIFCFYLLICANIETPTLPDGHRSAVQECNCSDPFKDTKMWYKGKRGAFYCIATSKKSGKRYKRYLSSWLKLKKK